MQISKIALQPKLKKRRGSVLVFVLIIFLVVSIITSTVIFIFNNNLKQAKHQQDRMEAYYLAYSGAELAYAALNENKSKLDNLVADPTKKEETIDISFGNGTIDVVARKTDEENFKGWIKIISIAVLVKNDVSYTRILYFDPSNPAKKVWVNG